MFWKKSLSFLYKRETRVRRKRWKDTVIKNAHFSGSSLWFLWEIMGGAQPRIYGVKIWLMRQDGDKRVLVAAANLHKSGCPFDRFIVFNLLASKNDQRWIVCLSCVPGAIKRRLCHYGKCTRISLLSYTRDGCCCGPIWVKVLIYIEGYILGLLNLIYEVVIMTHLHWNIERM